MIRHKLHEDLTHCGTAIFFEQDWGLNPHKLGAKLVATQLRINQTRGQQIQDAGNGASAALLTQCQWKRLGKDIENLETKGDDLEFLGDRVPT